eukprot:TRINITY_DN1229_c0_g3_i2.p1 TRINITY_DN1229_c0_g3~~TRINITY_DN1229_c0_g3_i2.p1  ORF type:complete len:157 (-),score=37.30 TRINITY_DN1229_c0_g3_i2:148-618(-)
MNRGPPMPPEDDPTMGPNPMWEVIKDLPIDYRFVGSFLMENPEFLEDDDKKSIQKISSVLTRNLLISAGVGLFLNLQLKRIPKINFLNWNFLFRYAVRGPIFFAPFFTIFGRDATARFEDMNVMYLKYRSRLVRFQRTGDMRVLIPDDKMKKFSQQ